MTKTRYEYAMVRPGEVTPIKSENEKTSANDPKMAVLMCWWSSNIKGS